MCGSLDNSQEQDLCLPSCPLHLDLVPLHSLAAFTKLAALGYITWIFSFVSCLWANCGARRHPSYAICRQKKYIRWCALTRIAPPSAHACTNSCKTLPVCCPPHRTGSGPGAGPDPAASINNVLWLWKAAQAPLVQSRLFQKIPHNIWYFLCFSEGNHLLSF